jgi:uncharacterized membrane protein YoaK (UPF0700 family)
MAGSRNRDTVFTVLPRYLFISLPVLLSFVAGYVDSCTFLGVFGLFVAQVTGSFVLIGAQLIENGPRVLASVMGPLAFFIAAGATAAVTRVAERHRTDVLPAALAVEAALLAGLLALWVVSSPMEGPDAAAVLPVTMLGLSAMGVQSALVRLRMPGSPSTNVMTTNTSQFAIETADFVLAWRRRRTSTDPESASEYANTKKRMATLFKVLISFLCGTLAGAAAYTKFDLWCILLAIAIVGAVSVIVAANRDTGANANHLRPL